MKIIIFLITAGSTVFALINDYSDGTQQNDDDMIFDSFIRDSNGQLPNAQPFFFNPSNKWLESAAKSVAKLVSSSFPSTTSNPNRQANPDLMGNILKIIGLDSSKLLAVAVNGLIFLAQMINSSFMENENSQEKFENPPPGSPMTWMFDNSPPEAIKLVREAHEKSLPDRLIDLLRDSATVPTDCIQLLICKVGPIISSMQYALINSPSQKGWKQMTPLDRMLSYFPKLKTLSENSLLCDERFPSCKYRYTN